MRFAIFASTNGTDIPALVEGTRGAAECRVLITDKADCGAIEKAEHYNIPVVFVSPQGKSREQFEAEITKVLQQEKVELICLVGFMRILGAEFVRQWERKIINVHPSLLPKYPGMRAIEEVLAAGEEESGATVHFVDEGVDTGEVITQKKIPVFPGDDFKSLKKRIQEAEQEIYPEVVRGIAEKRLKIS